MSTIAAHVYKYTPFNNINNNRKNYMNMHIFLLSLFANDNIIIIMTAMEYLSWSYISEPAVWINTEVGCCWLLSNIRNFTSIIAGSPQQIYEYFSLAQTKTYNILLYIYTFSGGDLYPLKKSPFSFKIHHSLRLDALMKGRRSQPLLAICVCLYSCWINRNCVLLTKPFAASFNAILIIKCVYLLVQLILLWATIIDI